MVENVPHYGKQQLHSEVLMLYSEQTHEVLVCVLDIVGVCILGIMVWIRSILLLSNILLIAK